MSDMKVSVVRGTIDVEARIKIVDGIATVTYHAVQKRGDRIHAEGELQPHDAATLVHMRS
jgi:hypothetical protein